MNDDGVGWRGGGAGAQAPTRGCLGGRIKALAKALLMQISAVQISSDSKPKAWSHGPAVNITKQSALL